MDKYPGLPPLPLLSALSPQSHRSEMKGVWFPTRWESVPRCGDARDISGMLGGGVILPTLHLAGLLHKGGPCSGIPIQGVGIPWIKQPERYADYYSTPLPPQDGEDKDCQWTVVSFWSIVSILRQCFQNVPVPPQNYVIYIFSVFTTRMYHLILLSILQSNCDTDKLYTFFVMLLLQCDEKS
jgi:hypothetical protein